MHPADNQVGPVHAVDIVGHAFRLAGRHAAVVFGTSLIVQTSVLAVSFVAVNALGITGGMILWFLLSMAAYQVSIGIYTLFLLHLRHGHPMPSALYLLKESAPLVLPLLWLGILSTLGIGLGFLFFFVPGVILSLRWAVSAPALVAKRVSATEALSLSTNLTKGAYGTVFALGLIQNLIANVLPQLMVSNPATPFENILLIQGLFAAVCTPVVALASAELFLRLARVPNRIDGDAPLDEAAPAPAGPYVPLGAPAASAPAAGPYVPLSSPAAPVPAHMYAANGQPPAAPIQPYSAPIQPPAPAYAPPASEPMPGLPGPPASAERAQSVGPPGMG